jgi:hypothetical protein
MHYICTGGCRGESQSPGVCQAANCVKRGQLLTVCGCADGRHRWEEGAASGRRPSDSDNPNNPNKRKN